MSEQDILKYGKMLEEDPHSRAFAPLAEAYRKAGNLDEAIRVAETGLEIHPGYTGGLVVLGRALYEKRELDRAVEVLKEAVAETPESYLGQKFLGKVLMERGEIEAALDALETANTLSPGDGEVDELIKEIRPKAQQTEAMVFSDASGEEGPGKTGVTTHEEKPTTVDGVELEPLLLKADEETFDFSEIQEGEESLTPGTGAGAEGIPEPEGDAHGGPGPETAAFTVEADQTDDAVFTISEEELDREETSFTIDDLLKEVSAEPERVQPPSSPPEGGDRVDVGQPPVHGDQEIAASPFEEADSTTPAVPLQDAPESPAPPPTYQSPDSSSSTGDISTETLADLYARQGLVEKAAEIYQQILLQRPSDKGVLAKLRELEENAGAHPRDDRATIPETAVRDMSAADTDDVLNILENWLQNAERMKRK